MPVLTTSNDLAINSQKSQREEVNPRTSGQVDRSAKNPSDNASKRLF